MIGTVPQLTEEIFLNHAAISPIAPIVAKESIDALTALSTGAPDINGWVLAMEKSRKLVAKLIDCESSSIGFMQNTSQAISTVAQGLTWQEGDEILIPEIEYPANQYPWLNLATKEVIIKRAPVPEGNISIEWLKKHCSNKTKLLAFSMIQFSNGFASPVKEIVAYCKAHNILTLVDVIQGFGAFPVNVKEWDVDFCAFGSQKWLMAPPGISVLYIHPEKIDAITPPITGAFSVKNPFDVQNIALDFPQEVKKIESGTMNFTLFPAFLKALELFEEQSVTTISESIRERATLLSHALISKGYTLLSPKNEKEMTGIVVCTGEEANINTLYERLCQQKITVTYRNNTIRFSPHFYNSIEALKEVVKLF